MATELYQYKRSILFAPNNFFMLPTYTMTRDDIMKVWLRFIIEEEGGVFYSGADPVLARTLVDICSSFIGARLKN